jgi:hypothetical protein
VAVIVTLGSVAGAISTVISLWPSPDANDSAQVTVRIVPGVPLSEYQRRVESAGVIVLKGYSPPDDVGTAESAPSAELSEAAAPTPTATADPDPDAPASPPPDAVTDLGSNPDDLVLVEPPEDIGPIDPTDDIVTVEPPVSSGPDEFRTDGVVVEPELDHDVAVGQINQNLEAIMGDSVPSEFIAIGNSIGSNGELIDPAVAAERIAKVLTDARHIPTATEPEPLGVHVSTDLELTGLRAEKLTLTWSLWQAAGDVRLSGDWLNENLAYRIEPRTDHATTTLDVWIPMPREPGTYFVRVDLRSGPTRIDSGESERFE